MKSLPIEIVTNQRRLVCPAQVKIRTRLRLGLDTGLAVGHLDTDLLRPGNDFDALPC